jgi:hypothetical protein
MIGLGSESPQRTALCASAVPQPNPERYAATAALARSLRLS